MQGRFEVALHRVGRMTDREVLAAIKREGLDEVLRRAPREVHCPKQHNLAYNWIPAWIFNHTMGGAGVGYPYDNYGVNAGGLSSHILLTLDTDPYYDERIQGYWAPGVSSYQCNSDGTSGKRFIDDDIEDHRIVTFADAFENPPSDLKESLLFRSRWLFLPSEATTFGSVGTPQGAIASIAYYYSDDANSGGSDDRGVFGRVRLRDELGKPTRISKSPEHVLLVEIELEFVTI